MRMGLCRRVSPFILLLVAVSGQADPASVSREEKLPVRAERVFRPARHLVGNTGLFPQQEIDRAAWITHPDDAAGGRGVRVLRFERTFRSSGEVLELDVTADERFVLRIDGEFVCRGPHRGTVDDWTYQSYRVALAPGEHVVEATVWRLGDAAPVAQLSHHLGFCLKAVGSYDAELTTGRGAWRVCAIPGLRSIGKSGGPFGTGDCFEMTGSGFLDRIGTDWTTPTVIRPPMPDCQGLYGVRQSGWRLFPSQLPDQTETRIRPGRFVQGGELRFPMVVRPGESRQVLWDLGRYWCAYPEAIVSGGRGGRISWRPTRRFALSVSISPFTCLRRISSSGVRICFWTGSSSGRIT